MAKAQNSAEAIRMIENDEIEFSDISGYQPVRANYISLFKDVVSDGDFWKQENNKLLFGKKYDGIQENHGFLAVTLDINNNELGILSFHPRKFNDKVLSGNIQWNIKNGRLPGDSASGKVFGRAAADTLTVNFRNS